MVVGRQRIKVSDLNQLSLGNQRFAFEKLMITYCLLKFLDRLARLRLFAAYMSDCADDTIALKVQLCTEKIFAKATELRTSLISCHRNINLSITGTDSFWVVA